MSSHILASCNSLSRSANLRLLMLKSSSAWISNPIWPIQFQEYCKASKENPGGERTSSASPDEELKTRKTESLMEAERAPSTAEEFERVAAEKQLKEAEKEDVFEDSDLQSNKNSYKQQGGGAAAGEADKSRV